MSETPVEQQAAATPKAPSDDDVESELSPEELKLPQGLQNQKTLARQIRKRLRNDKDAVVIVSGERGNGKSVLAMELAREINPNFDVSKHLLYDPDVKQLYDLVYNSPPYSVFVVDEAIRLAHSRTAMSLQNILLVELISLCRFKNHCIIFCLPLMGSIDSAVRSMCTFWLHVLRRGTAVIFKPDPNPFISDVFAMRQSSDILRAACGNEHLSLASLNELMNGLRDTPAWIGWLSFPDIDPETKAKYQAGKKPYQLRLTRVQEHEQRMQQKLEEKTRARADEYESKPSERKRRGKREYAVLPKLENNNEVV